jgi:hypothetical protein
VFPRDATAKWFPKWATRLATSNIVDKPAFRRSRPAPEGGRAATYRNLDYLLLKAQRLAATKTTFFAFRKAA